jgi:hypothetical protein
VLAKLRFFSQCEMLKKKGGGGVQNDRKFDVMMEDGSTIY